MWFFWKEVRVVKTTLIRDLTFFKLTHHEVKEARRRRRKKKTTTTTSTVYGTLKPATSDKLHYCRHVRRARHRATEKHSEWCVQMHLKTKEEKPWRCLAVNDEAVEKPVGKESTLSVLCSPGVFTACFFKIKPYCTGLEWLQKSTKQQFYQTIKTIIP